MTAAGAAATLERNGHIPAALLELHAGEAEHALSVLDRAAHAPASRTAAWHAVRGMALLARERWQDASTSLREAVSLGDRTPVTALNLALARSHLERDGARHDLSNLEREHPNWEEPPFRLAELLRAEGRTDAAAAAYERALAVAPGRVEALLRLATLHIGCGAASRAKSLLVRCCDVAPANWEAWDALGLTCCILGSRTEAMSAFRQAYALHPTSVAIALRLAGTAAAVGESHAELLRFEAASATDPLQVSALAGRASLLCDLGRDEHALELLEAAAAIDPHSSELAAFRAERLLRGSRNEAALEALRHAAALDPANRGLQNNLAVALTRSHRYAEALDVLDELQTLQGERADMLCNRANALVCLGRQDEGVATARRAVALSNEGSSERHLAVRTLASAQAYHEAVDGQSLTQAMRAVSDTAHRNPSDIGGGRQRQRPGGSTSTKRLKLGLLSATLKTHPVGWLTLAGFENLDPSRFEIVCIGQREGSDPMQRRFRAIASEWHALAEGQPGTLVDQVRDMRLDMLIDLGGYGDHGMLSLCARRLAPVQIKWVGMQAHTTALPEIDWFVSDRWETPPHLASLYTERLLLLDDGYVCYSPPVHAPACTPLPALRSGAVTFGCFNNLAKITPRVISTWSAILRETPGARLVLKTHQLADPSTAEFVRHGFAAHGIARERLDLRGGSRHPDLLAEYGDVDLVLDPFPYSGGLTTCEALWMGVPVLTWPGETFASRHSASHLCNIGLHDWVVPDLDTYCREAVRRAADLPALADLRAGLRTRMRLSPLCDGPRFGRTLTAALTRAWSETAS